MKKWILFISVIIICTSCDSFQIERFNQEAYDEYIQKGNSFRVCSIIEGNFLDIDMNKPEFEFYLDNKKLSFNKLENLDTFFRTNQLLLERHRISLVGRENVKVERIDSVTNLLNKYNRRRFVLSYQKGFWEK